MNNAASIVLTGFMATGKSTVGALLARQLGREFFDMDAAIIERVGLPIADIFAQFGEPFFRAIERGICHEVAMRNQLVVATGGGAIIDPDSRDALLKHTMVICLSADMAQIEARLQTADNRPLASVWRDRLLQRLPIYESLPFQINTTDKTPEQVVEEIILLWRTASL